MCQPINHGVRDDDTCPSVTLIKDVLPRGRYNCEIRPIIHPARADTMDLMGLHYAADGDVFLSRRQRANYR